MTGSSGHCWSHQVREPEVLLWVKAVGQLKVGWWQGGSEEEWQGVCQSIAKGAMSHPGIVGVLVHTPEGKCAWCVCTVCMCGGEWDAGVRGLLVGD